MLLARTAVEVCTVAEPFCWTCCETLCRLFTAPRGTPSPAMPFWTTSLLGMLLLNTGCPTMTVAAPAVGGTGGLKRCGALVTGTTGYHPPANTPGCQPHPNPGTKAQLPYRYGIQPHG